MTQASGRHPESDAAAPTPPDAAAPTPAFDPAAREAFLAAVSDYLEPDEARHVRETLALAESAAQQGAAEEREALRPRLADALDTAMILADGLRIDVVTLAATLLAPLVDANALSPRDVTQRLGAELGERVTRAIGAIERFDALHLPGVTLRRQAAAAPAPEDAEASDRRKGRERRRAQDEDALRKMFLGVAEDPRVVVVKVADHLRLMRVAAAQAARIRERQDTLAEGSSASAPGDMTLDDIRTLAEETHALYAPLAARLGMGRVDAELEDLAFAILQPDDYRWLVEAVAEETSGRRDYVARVCQVLADEMRKIGIEAEVSGRVKHLYSIYRKVVRSGSRDLSQLYDILAFRIITTSIADCYLALGHVHDLWRPVDGRIKDFIANPKSNGYRSLHTTVFCLDNRLAEVQIRTRQMHETAEYGVAMHWYYKDVGDSARADARALQQWMQQVMDWRQELKDASKPGAQAEVPGPPTALQEQIFVFTPRGDVRELPAGATPLDFAYRVHTDLGNHVAGVRITQNSESGRPVKKLVPLDYELKNGDIVEVIKRNDAHPTRDWLRIVRTKVARARILHYLKTHERDIDIQVGRERLDRDLRATGLRKGYDELTEDDLKWIVEELKLSDADTLLAMVGADKLRPVAVVNKVRERLKLLAPAEPEPETPTLAPARDLLVDVSVEGMAGLLTQIANCCHPLPGDDLRGYISRGRGVVIHRADCPNLRRLLEKEPGRGIAVAWPKSDSQQVYRAPVVVEGGDRMGLVRDVTGVIAEHKLNMVKIDVTTNQRTHKATITAVLEIQRPEQLEAVLKGIRAIDGVLQVGRKAPAGARGIARE
ncbi:MAG: bifunctional (p)ppGpp synthetase/guanosine-3',5'-bis(diphosphate) 3'-pyrophosphohydrolase [Chloroflexota bacterium]|nr:bifunctional (p)ppGpp synthetase/guanosine-3',5'-bis(diphosphate) 3'-pyrophosphohydrolase [Chloroflexota bacterium]